MDLEQLKKIARERYIPVVLDDAKQLLYNTVKQAQPHNILEIGTAIGYSGIVMLSACSCARLNTVEISEESAAMARSNFSSFGYADRVNIFVGDALQIVPMLSGNYDFIFLDGPKGQYLKLFHYLNDLLTEGGTLVCDNVLYKGLVEHVPQDKRHKHITVARNMRAFLDALTADARYDTVLHRVGDGVTVSVKRTR